MSNRYYSAYDDVLVTTNALIPGSPYFITVDNYVVLVTGVLLGFA